MSSSQGNTCTLLYEADLEDLKARSWGDGDGNKAIDPSVVVRMLKEGLPPHVRAVCLRAEGCAAGRAGAPGFANLEALQIKQGRPYNIKLDY
jgi:hypothetical protein